MKQGGGEEEPGGGGGGVDVGVSSSPERADCLPFYRQCFQL